MDCNLKSQIFTLGHSTSNTYCCDLARSVPVIDKYFDVVIHAAGKAHVYPKTEAEKAAFFAVNTTGTRHLLKGLRPEKVGRMVYISTVAVYGKSSGEQIVEDTPVQWNTPYGESKWRAEQLILDWCRSHDIPYLILRLPLVAGPQPKGNLQKMIQAINRGKYLRIARGEAQKSIVWAADIAHLIEDWATRSHPPSGIYHLTDGVHPTFYQLEEGIRRALGKGNIPTLPIWAAKLMGKVGDVWPRFPVNSGTITKITNTFTFSDAKARHELGWRPTPVLDKIEEMVYG